ncbi:MAG TPA: glycosyltransferase family 25 protein [Rhabdochlamydiaceae bacterium]|nr:glycosyltransferase family 25 protein [Rhabdochlamydiaceae bacterium]
MIKYALFFLLFSLQCYAGIENQYRKLENKKGCVAPRNIDYVYMINLDQRPEKWNRSSLQLSPFGIIPERFPGIYGWTLQPDVLNDMGLKFQHGMWTGREYVMVFPPDKNGEYEFIFLNGACYGKACFSGWTVKGTIGCTLSHLSVFKDAYDSGYQTIWVMEDDIVVVEDPHRLSAVIEDLDALVGSDGWDVLYTDYDCLFVDKEKDLASQIPLKWRPDMPFLNIQYLIEHQDMGEKFVKIGSRNRAHSIIYRRSGLQKIMDFYKTHDNFLPFDEEISLIPGMRLFVVKKSIVSYHEITSDTRYRYFNK